METSGTRGHPKYLENLYDYYNILYEPEIIKNKNYDVRKYGDLQNLHFQDENFDVILSSDVFEHLCFGGLDSMLDLLRQKFQNMR